MIPLRDDNPTTRRPLVTLTFIALNVLAFILWQGAFTESDQEQQVFFFCSAMIPYEVTNQTTLGEGGQDAAREIAEQFDEPLSVAREDQQFLARHCDDKSWWQSLFVAMFLHGGWLHIAGNMLFLWVFGNNVEDKLGPILFFLFYLAGGLAASAAQIIIQPDSVIPNVGASGAIAAVLGAYLVMFPRRRVLTLVIFVFITAVYLPAFVVLGLWFVLQLFNGVAGLGTDVSTGGGVAFWAHIGGFAFGALVALLFLPKERLSGAPPPRRPDVWRGHPVRGWGTPRRPDQEPPW
jgi:membrane associated rhomboid family serine protease